MTDLLTIDVHSVGLWAFIATEWAAALAALIYDKTKEIPRA